MRVWMVLLLLVWAIGAAAQVLLSELLFDPPAGGVDYIELFNAGAVAVDLSGWRLGNGRSAPKLLVHDSYLLMPGEYLAVSADTAWVRLRYGGHGRLLPVEALPSYPNERGLVQLIDSSGRAVDSVAYSADWHQVLVRDPEGVALERVSFTVAAGNSLNWTSAAFRNGVYGSPGLANGQAVAGVEKRKLWLEQGGQQVLLHYRFPDRGQVLTVRVYTVGGMLVRQLLRNGICGQEGLVVWDGRGEGGRQLVPGGYIVVAEGFHPTGSRWLWRKAVGVNW